MKTVKKAWTQLPGIKILKASEWRRDVAQEALDTKGGVPWRARARGARNASTKTAHMPRSALIFWGVFF